MSEDPTRFVDAEFDVIPPGALIPEPGLLPWERASEDAP